MMGLFSRDKARKIEKAEEEGTLIDFGSRPIRPGVEFPPLQDRERLARYATYKKVFDGKHDRLFERAQHLLKDTEHGPQLDALRIAINFADILATKPADLLVGEAPTFESGLPDDSPTQRNLNRYVEESDLVQTIYKSAVQAAVCGDSFIRTKRGYYEDYSQLTAEGYPIPANAEYGASISVIDPSCVFPETTKSNSSKFRAINVAIVHSYEFDGKDYYYLDVEREVPGLYIKESFDLQPKGVDSSNEYGYPITTYTIGKLTSREVIPTASTKPLVHHIPNKVRPTGWEGISSIRAILPIMQTISDRLTQIDYILLKHSDPMMYGPELDEVKSGGYYIPIGDGDQTPGYLTWNSQLDAAFKELELLIATVFQLSETPQWLFGTALGTDTAGSGTSHTDGASIRARFMPILSKVNRLRVQYDRAIRDALYQCQELEVGTKVGIPVYPTINWQDGLPVNEMEQAEIAQLRTGGKPTLDVHDAIKRLDNVDDEKAQETITRMKAQDAVVTTLDEGEGIIV